MGRWHWGSRKTVRTRGLEEPGHQGTRWIRGVKGRVNLKESWKWDRWQGLRQEPGGNQHPKSSS